MGKNKKYFDYQEKNKIKMQEEIDEINKLNDELNKENQEIKKELDEYKEKLDEYEETLYTVNNEYDKIMKALKEENNELNNKYLEEKQIMEQEKQMMKQKIEILERQKQIMEQEINEKEQQLQNNNVKISELKKSKKFIIKRLDNYRITSESKIKENELKNDIKKLKELNKMLTEKPIILQDVKKRENKVRTFAPPDDISNFKDPLGSADNEREKLKLFFDKKFLKILILIIKLELLLHLMIRQG